MSASASRASDLEGLDGVGRYHLLRAASARFQCEPAALSEGQLREALARARKSLEIESLVLASREARQVLIPTARVEGALAALRSRYPDSDAFLADLRRNGLDLETLGLALRRELAFDAVMQRVAARQVQVDEIDLRLYYELHRRRFISPERRTARHILITLNDRFEENQRDRVLARMQRLMERLAGRPSAVARHFPDLARRHSECPTALEGGRLGEVRRGQLYPELDALLFRLGQGQVGGPAQSELGLHLIWCERIHPEQILPFPKVRDTIRQALVERRRRASQTDWLAELRQSASRNPATHP